MPRFLVERTFPDGLLVPIDGDGAAACAGVVDRNAGGDVTWIHSYVSPDKTKSFCIYDGPTESAIRSAADRSQLPVDSVTEVRVLDPYFYY